MSHTIIDDLYDRVEDFCIDDTLLESDVEIGDDDISLCEGDDIEDSIDQLDESNVEFLLSDNDNNEDDGENNKYVPPPMPLFTVGELGISSDDIKIISGKKIRHIEHIPPDPTLLLNVSAPSSSNSNKHNKNININDTMNDNSTKSKLFDPMCARKLGKWFMLRAKREICLLNMFKSGPADTKDNYAYVSASDVYTSTIFDLEENDNNTNLENFTTFCLPNNILDHSSNNINNSLIFDGDFESGNLRKAIRMTGREPLGEGISELYSECVDPIHVDHEYDLLCRNDVNTAGYIQWFYFMVQTPNTDDVTYPLTVRFNLINMMKRDALYNYGMKPAVYSQNRANEKLVSWIHDGTDICYYKNGLEYVRRKKTKSYYTLSFTYTFTRPDTVYFAHCFPYTYTNLQRYLLSKSQDSKIASFFKRRLLCKTLAGNNCDLIVIAADPTTDGQVSKERSTIVVSSRIHPGESQSSFMLQGLIDYLTADTAESRALRNNFIFKIVPMLNPDGVIHGNYRCSMAGTDLNRRYGDALQFLHPTVHAMRELLEKTHETRGILLYLDLHGHSRHKNAFLYGCDINLQSPKNIKKSQQSMTAEQFAHQRVFNRIFPRMLAQVSNSKNGGYFNYDDCSYRVQSSKGGTGRVVAWKKLCIPAAYTIELSFCGVGDNNESKIFKKLLQMERRGMVEWEIEREGYNSNSSKRRNSNKSNNTAQSKSNSSDRNDYKNINDKNSSNNNHGNDDEDDAQAFDVTELSKRSLRPSYTNNIGMGGDMDEDSFRKEVLMTKDGYKRNTHWSTGDYLRMGTHLGQAILKFCNIHITENDKYCDNTSNSTNGVSNDNTSGFFQSNLQENSDDSDSDDGDEIDPKLYQKVSKVKSYDATTPVLQPAVYSVESIQSIFSSDNMKQLMETRKSKINSDSSMNHDNNNDNFDFIPPLLNDRLLTELSIRNSLGLETGVNLSLVQKSLSIRSSMLAKKMALEAAEKAAQDKAMKEAEVGSPTGTSSNWVNNNDNEVTSPMSSRRGLNSEEREYQEEDIVGNMSIHEYSAEILNFVEEADAEGADGSDSDPSGDNLPISTLMKSKALKKIAGEANTSKMLKSYKKKRPRRKTKESINSDSSSTSSNPIRKSGSLELLAFSSSMTKSPKGKEGSTSTIGTEDLKNYARLQRQRSLEEDLVNKLSSNRPTRRRGSTSSLPRFIQSYKLDDEESTTQQTLKVRNVVLDKRIGSYTPKEKLSGYDDSDQSQNGSVNGNNVTAFAASNPNFRNKAGMIPGGASSPKPNSMREGDLIARGGPTGVAVRTQTIWDSSKSTKWTSQSNHRQVNNYRSTPDSISQFIGLPDAGPRGNSSSTSKGVGNGNGSNYDTGLVAGLKLNRDGSGGNCNRRSAGSPLLREHNTMADTILKLIANDRSSKNDSNNNFSVNMNSNPNLHNSSHHPYINTNSNLSTFDLSKPPFTPMDVGSYPKWSVRSNNSHTNMQMNVSSTSNHIVNSDGYRNGSEAYDILNREMDGVVEGDFKSSSSRPIAAGSSENNKMSGLYSSNSSSSLPLEGNFTLNHAHTHDSLDRAVEVDSPTTQRKTILKKRYNLDR